MKMADLTIDELKVLIKKAVKEEIKDLLEDPDKGLKLRKEFEERLNTSLASKERIPFKEVKKRLGLD